MKCNGESCRNCKYNNSIYKSVCDWCSPCHIEALEELTDPNYEECSGCKWENKE